MAALTGTTNQLVGAYPAVLTAGGVVLAGANATGGGATDTIGLQVNDTLIVQNTHASATIDVTVVSKPDGIGRLGDASKAAVPAGGLVVFGQYTSLDGWIDKTTNLVGVTVAGTGTAKIYVLRPKA